MKTTTWSTTTHIMIQRTKYKEEKTKIMESIHSQLSKSRERCDEYVENNGQVTLLSALLKRIPIKYKVKSDVSEQQCVLFLSDTRNVFVALHDIVPHNPFVHLLCVLAGVQTEKSGKMRTSIVASLMRPFSERLKAHDENVLLSDDGMFQYFTSFSVPIMRQLWSELSPNNRDILWLWLDRIIENVAHLTEPI